MNSFDEAYQRCKAGASRAGWHVTTRADGPVTWCMFDPPNVCTPSHGWKLHVSFAETELARAFDMLLPALLTFGAPCKIVADLPTLYALNEGRAGESQVGKNLTVYPEDADAFRAIAGAVRDIWPRGLGPAIAGDLALCARGNIGMRYGAFSGDVAFVDAVGRVKNAIVAPDGQLVLDDRQSGVPPPWAPPPPLQPLAKPDLSAPFDAGGSAWVPVALLQSTAKGDVRMAMRTEEPFELVFVKSARRGVLATSNGYDAIDLLRREYTAQTDLFKQGFPCAQPLEFVEGSDQAVAISLDLEGEPLALLRLQQAQRYMPEVLRLVRRLHRLGYVHRDLKPQNILLAKNGLALIDFELACVAEAVDAPGAKTDGYCTTDSTDSSFARDYKAVAAILAWAWLGVHPTGNANALEVCQVTLQLHGMGHVAKWVERLVQADSCDLNALATEVEASLHEPCKLPPAPTAQFTAQDLAHSALYYLATFAHIDNPPDQTCWRNARNEGDTFNEGLYRGTAGVTLALMTFEEACFVDYGEHIANACNWLVHRPLHEASAGLFTGNAGVALVLAIAARRHARADWVAAAERYFNAALAAPLLEADLYFGASGILWCATLWDEALGGDAHVTRVRSIADWLLATLRNDENVWYWPNNGTLGGGRVPYLGVAHGAAGTAMALRAWACFIGQLDVVNLCDEILVRLFKHTKTRDGRQLAASLGAQDEANSAHVWCHGVGGFLWAVLQSNTPAERLKPAIFWSLERLLETPAVGNATYCHGLAGRLELLRMAAEHTDVEAARAVTVTALEHQARVSHGEVVWPCEDGTLVSPELWTGFLAPATALALNEIEFSNALISTSWLRRLAGGRCP